MALPSVSCFLGLDLLDQAQAIYEALYDAADDPSLTPPDCFKGQDARDQLTDIYAALLALGSITPVPPNCVDYDFGSLPDDSSFSIISPAGWTLHIGDFRTGSGGTSHMVTSFASGSNSVASYDPDGFTTEANHTVEVTLNTASGSSNAQGAACAIQPNGSCYHVFTDADDIIYFGYCDSSGSGSLYVQVNAANVTKLRLVVSGTGVGRVCTASYDNGTGYITPNGWNARDFGPGFRLDGGKGGIIGFGDVEAQYIDNIKVCQGYPGIEIHVTQSGAGSANGSDEANAWSVATYNSSNTPMGSDTVFFHGEITSSIAPNQGGSSDGNLILNFSDAALTTADPRITLKSDLVYIDFIGGSFGTSVSSFFGGANTTPSNLTVSGWTFTGSDSSVSSSICNTVRWSNVVVENNILDNAIYGFHDTTHAHDITIRNNYLRSAIDVTDQCDSIAMGDAYNVVIEGNHIINRAPGGGGAMHNDAIQVFRSGSTPNANPTNWTIRYNLIERAETDGSGGNMSWCQIEGIAGDPGIQIYGNVFRGSGVAWAGGNGIIIDVTTNPTDVYTFVNNTVISKVSPPNVVRFGTLSSHEGLLTYMNNVIYCGSPENGEWNLTENGIWNNNFHGNVTGDSISIWGPNGSGSLTSAAFTDYTNNDFSSAPGSVLRNAGTPSVGSEYNQGIAFGATWPDPSLVTRTAGNWDAGAYQFAP